MNKIKFSHFYNKMPFNSIGLGRTARLLEVFVITKKELSPEFVTYDTSIKDSQDYYSLPNGKLLILLLMSNNQLWTTIRSYNPQKHEYYKNLRGQDVEIIVEKS